MKGSRSGGERGEAEGAQTPSAPLLQPGWRLQEQRWVPEGVPRRL